VTLLPDNSGVNKMCRADTERKRLLKTSFTLGSTAFDMVSMENGRALFRAVAPSSLGTGVTAATIEISHLTTKGNARRSMAKLTFDVLGADSKVHTDSVHIVLSHDPQDSTAENQMTDMVKLFLAFISQMSETSNPDFVNALMGATFVPDTYANPIA